MKMLRAGNAGQSTDCARPKTGFQADGAQRDAHPPGPKELTRSGARRRLPTHPTAVLAVSVRRRRGRRVPLARGPTPPGKLVPGAGNADPNPENDVPDPRNG